MQNSSSNASGDLLIVDDLADNLRVLSNTLSNQGYRVRCVKNGQMALVGAKAIPPDVILLDIRMPEMDGYEVCRRLKADLETRDIPIIFLSALDETQDKAKAFAVGGADYLTKPFQVEEVLARVQHQLTIQRLKKQLGQQEQLLSRLEADDPSTLPLPDKDTEVYNKVLSAIVTILDYSTRLSENPAINSEQHAALKIIYQNGRALLDLINK